MKQLFGLYYTTLVHTTRLTIQTDATKAIARKEIKINAGMSHSPQWQMTRDLHQLLQTIITSFPFHAVRAFSKHARVSDYEQRHLDGHQS